MANIPLQYPFPYKTTNNTGFTSSVEFNTVTVLGDVTIDQNLTVAGNITTTDLTVGDDLTVGGTIDAQALRAFGIWDSPTATVTGAGAWIGFDGNGHTIFANRKSSAGQTNSWRWYAFDHTNAFQGELMRLSNAGNLFISGTRIEFPLVHFQQPPGTFPQYDFILPSSMGGAGQVLTSAGAGNPTYWTTPSGGGGGGGTVTNVSASVPSFLSVTVSNPTTTPAIAISGTSTGTGSVVLQTSPTINDTLTITNPITTFFDSITSYAPNLGVSHSNTFRIGKSSTSGENGYIQYGHQNSVSNRVIMGIGSNQISVNMSGQFSAPGVIGSSSSWNFNPTTISFSSSGASLQITNSGGTSGTQNTLQVIGSGLTTGAVQTVIGQSSSTAGNFVSFGWKHDPTLGNRYGYINTNNANVMTFATNGNVGIGTTAPGAKFVVEGAPAAFGIQYLASTATLSTTINTVDILHRWYESTGNASYIDLSWIRTSAGGNWVSAGQRFQAKVDTDFQAYIQFNGDNNYGLSFGTGFSSTAHGVAERMRITETGDVGIGTTTPGCKVDVLTTLGNTAMRLKGTPESLILDGTDHVFMRYAWAGVNKAYVGFGNAGDPNFDISNVATGGHINLFPNANVGIGTTSPAAKLHVNGSLLVQGAAITQNGAQSEFSSGSYSDPDSGQVYNAKFGNTDPLSNGIAVKGNSRFTSSVRAANFTTNGTNTFTYASGTFTPRIAMYYTSDGKVYECNDAPAGKDNMGITYSVQTGVWVRVGNLVTVNMEIQYSQTYAGITFDLTNLNIVAVIPEAACNPSTLGVVGMTGYPSRIADRFEDNFQMNYWISNTPYAPGGTICEVQLRRNNTHNMMPWDPTSKSGQRLNITTSYYVNQ